MAKVNFALRSRRLSKAPKTPEPAQLTALERIGYINRNLHFKAATAVSLRRVSLRVKDGRK